MTLNAKCMLEAKRAEATWTTQYIAPTGTRAIIDKFDAYNGHTSSVELSVHLVESGGNASAANLIVSKLLEPGESDTFPEIVGNVLNAGDFISTIADTGTVVVMRACERIDEPSWSNDVVEPIVCVPDPYYTCGGAPVFDTAPEDFSGGLTPYTTISGNRAIYSVSSGTYGQTLVVASNTGSTIAIIRRALAASGAPHILRFKTRVTSSLSDDSTEISIRNASLSTIVGVLLRREAAVDALRRPLFFHSGGSVLLGTTAATIGDWHQVEILIGAASATITITNLATSAVLVTSTQAIASGASPAYLQFSQDSNVNTCPSQFADIEVVASGARTVLSIHADTRPPIDQSCYQTKTLALTGSASISAAESKFGGRSIFVPNAGSSTLNGLQVTDHQDFDFGTGDFTIDLWAYRNANTYVGTLFYGTLGGGEFSVKVGTDGLIDLVYRSSGGSQSFSDVATWPVGEWVYFVTRRSGVNWETYLNDALIHSAAITGGASSTVNSGGDLYFGRTNVSSAESWNGYLDDIRVTKGAARDPTPPDLTFCESAGI